MIWGNDNGANGTTLSVYTNNGSGGFGSNTTLNVGAGPFSVVAADVNGDGRLDLISANRGDGTLSVLVNADTFAPSGSLRVNIAPSGAVSSGAKWQVDRGVWQSSGATVYGLPGGSHTVVFSPLAGWTAPTNQTVSVEINERATTTGMYVQLFGSLEVILAPAEAVSAGGWWRVDGGTWQDGGTTVGLAVGNHSVAFSTVAGWTAPSDQAITINADQTTTTTGVYAQQFGSLRVDIGPAGAVSAGAQWQVDGGAWENSGATIAALTLGSHAVAFLMVPGWGVPATQSVTVNFDQTTTTTAVYSAARPAMATAVVTNGFVVAATITDGGVGYTNTPVVCIVGGGGSGARATALVSNGVVTGITILDAGFGYTSTPAIAITPPFPLTIGIAAATGLGFTNLIVGKSYQLQVSQFGVWNNLGASFVAGGSTYWQYFNGWGGGSTYRLVALPIPYGATATPILAYGFVVAATVTDGGFGYVSVPNVVIVGGGGSGAQATATVSNGVVTAVSIMDAGFSYTSTPTIQIDPPPIPVLLPNVSRAVRLDYGGLTPALTYQLQVASNLANWADLGSSFTATANTNSQYLRTEPGSQLFRLWQH